MERIFLIFLSFSLLSQSVAGGLYQRYLVRMKPVASPRSPGSGNTVGYLKEQGRASLRPLMRVIQQNDQSLGLPRAPRSPTSHPVKSVSELWLVNAAAIICQQSYLEKLKNLDGVAEIIPDEVMEFSLGDSQDRGMAQHADRSGVEAYHQEGLNGQDILVGILDTGIEDHEIFSKRIMAYKDFTSSPQNQPMDPVGHGTHVAGILAGGSYQGQVLGMAPRAKLVVARVLEPISKEGGTDAVNRRVKAFASRVLNAMQWMIDPDGDPSTNDAPAVINNSWGFPDGLPITRPLFEDALSKWIEIGITPVFAAGNNGKKGENTILFPGNLKQVITVGALKDNRRAPFSGIGSADVTKPDFMAPGYRIHSLKKYGKTYLLGPMSGTSMAAPFITGLTVLMRQFDPLLGPDELYQVLKDSSRDLGDEGWDPEHGWGFPHPKTLNPILKQHWKARVEKGGKRGLRYYREFYFQWLETRNPQVQRRLIDTELGLLAFVESHFQAGHGLEPVLKLWLNQLEQLSRNEPDPYLPLYKRILKRIRFLSIPHDSKSNEKKAVQPSQ